MRIFLLQCLWTTCNLHDLSVYSAVLFNVYILWVYIIFLNCFSLFIFLSLHSFSLYFLIYIPILFSYVHFWYIFWTHILFWGILVCDYCCYKKIYQFGISVRSSPQKIYYFTDYLVLFSELILLLYLLLPTTVIYYFTHYITLCFREDWGCIFGSGKSSYCWT